MEEAGSIAIFVNPTYQYLHPEGLAVVQAACEDDIAAFLSAGRVESLSTRSIFGHLDFWFGSVELMSQTVNRPATELLLAATELTARTVPLLRGRVVLTSHDVYGGLAGLTRQQMSRIASYQARGRDQWVLGWRYGLDGRALRRRLKARNTAADRAAWDDFRRGLSRLRPTLDQ
ncbi:hypothetical protein OK015_28805 (plasmid) [Mycobacterium sp. Aquia_216]|uniref:hypothetical protein n=1 Tax=Mycobacterium sp. Aquia_216 TaxID=2991729 RepID=UPI00227A35B1|nr:hypothetical protein [Mycobacterium sp. Aquia_216]WAJ47954.1 hypothetical protein OK015_28805 [Mycobacterium sp. Aquia_216]